MSSVPARSSADPRSRLQELARRVDDHFARVWERYREQLECGPGCADCCVGDLTITLVEAAWIAEGLAGLSEAVRQEIASAAAAAPPERCPALDQELRCRIYQWRPLLCRSHGGPIRIPTAPVDQAAEGQLEVCDHNFRSGVRLDQVARSCVLDQETLAIMLGAIDIAFADECGASRNTRIRIGELLVEPGRYFEVG